MDQNTIRKEILELTSEAEWGSWDFWSRKDKTQDVCQLILRTLEELVKEGKIYPVEYETISKRTYEPAPLDVNRLAHELRTSMVNIDNVDPHKFYWFVATDEGKKEDISLRKIG